MLIHARRSTFRENPSSAHEILGQGGIAVVYKARDNRLNRLVALKFLLAARAASGDALKRFRREAESIAALNHPNIATLYEIGEWNGEPFLAMEYLSGGSLSGRRPARVDYDELRRYAEYAACNSKCFRGDAINAGRNSTREGMQGFSR